MTRGEYTGQFERLCKGFKHEPTQEQAEAWFRRIGHIGLSVWSEVVTTLLCGKYFPKLDDALEEVEREADRQKQAALAKDKAQAKKVYVLTQTAPPGLNAAYFRAIKNYAARDQARRLLHGLDSERVNETRSKPVIALYRTQWTDELTRLDKELVDLCNQLTPEENRALMTQYEVA